MGLDIFIWGEVGLEVDFLNRMDRKSRTSRSSLTGSNSSGVLGVLKSKIRELKAKSGKWDFFPGDGTTVQQEQILLGRKSKNIRKVYCNGDIYRVGWVVDCDLSCCMICLNYFGWYRYRHHCRACGSLVCAKCSPYVASIPPFQQEEPQGSRVCSNCFGLRCDVLPGSTLLSPDGLPKPAGVDNIFSPSDYTHGKVRRPSYLNASSNSQSPDQFPNDLSSSDVSPSSGRSAAPNSSNSKKYKALLSTLEAYESQQQAKYKDAYMYESSFDLIFVGVCISIF